MRKYTDMNRLLEALTYVYEQTKEPTTANMGKLFFKCHFTNRYVQVLIQTGLIHYYTNSKTSNSLKKWVGEIPDMNTAEFIYKRYKLSVKEKGWAKKNGKRVVANNEKFKEEKKKINKGYSTKPIKNNLTLYELKELWKMYKAGCNIDAIRISLSITKEYAIECIEAAKWAYGGGYIALKYSNAWYKKEHNLFKIIPKDESYIRPKAEYSNSSPLKIASPGI